MACKDLLKICFISACWLLSKQFTDGCCIFDTPITSNCSVMFRDDTGLATKNCLTEFLPIINSIHPAEGCRNDVVALDPSPEVSDVEIIDVHAYPFTCIGDDPKTISNSKCLSVGSLINKSLIGLNVTFKLKSPIYGAEYLKGFLLQMKILSGEEKQIFCVKYLLEDTVTAEDLEGRIFFIDAYRHGLLAGSKVRLSFVSLPSAHTTPALHVPYKDYYIPDCINLPPSFENNYFCSENAPWQWEPYNIHLEAGGDFLRVTFDIVTNIFDYFIVYLFNVNSWGRSSIKILNTEMNWIILNLDTRNVTGVTHTFTNILPGKYYVIIEPGSPERCNLSCNTIRSPKGSGTVDVPKVEYTTPNASSDNTSPTSRVTLSATGKTLLLTTKQSTRLPFVPPDEPVSLLVIILIVVSCGCVIIFLYLCSKCPSPIELRQKIKSMCRVSDKSSRPVRNIDEYRYIKQPTDDDQDSIPTFVSLRDHKHGQSLSGISIDSSSCYWKM